MLKLSRIRRAATGNVQRFDRAASAAAQQVIGQYSTSFSLATRLLAPPVRTDIRHLYAMVRVADELVDGTAAAASLDPLSCLDAYEKEVHTAIRQGFHTDPILHSFAQTANRCTFEGELISAFFKSMRSDVSTPVDLDTYVYGSAEVIGLLCLKIFLRGRSVPAADLDVMRNGARRLGAAFQKVNFLRDLSEDTKDLGRNYLGPIDNARKEQLVAEIDSDLAMARAATALLPLTARLGVRAATELFAELNKQLAKQPAATLYHYRVRVSAPRKAFIILRSLLCPQH